MSQNNNYIIYKVNNIWTGEVYIGATTNSIQQRKWDHIERAKRGESGKLHVALASWTNTFTWTKIDTANSIDDLAQKEKEYVIRYDSMENGYNSDAGGGIQKTVYQYRIQDGSLVNEFDSLESAGNAVSAHKKSIAKACSGENKTCKGYCWSYTYPIPVVMKDQRRKTVLQMDQGGLVLAEYNSVTEASRITGISKTCISRCCRGERNYSGGYNWKYL
ncbi:NUMOD1 domain-containing DNA-binding protein [Flavobacteriaceae bacterium KMM 6897]|nr:NUMOD1 domain-containing DNA-binding protein [Flavobacteriaceae bacterium KMM 6897]